MASLPGAGKNGHMFVLVVIWLEPLSIEGEVNALPVLVSGDYHDSIIRGGSAVDSGDLRRPHP